MSIRNLKINDAPLFTDKELLDIDIGNCEVSLEEMRAEKSQVEKEIANYEKHLAALIAQRKSC